MPVKNKKSVIKTDYPNTAVIYCRVSSKKQLKGLSIEDQKQASEIYCEKNGFQVLATFSDSFSGQKITRIGLGELFKFVESNPVGYCVIHKVDRITRGELKIFNEIENTLNISGVKLRDTEGILCDEEIAVEEINGVSVKEYNWNRIPGTKQQAVLKVMSASDELKTFMQRTIFQEIKHTQLGFHEKSPLYGYVNEKRFFPEHKVLGTIMVPHVNEAPLIRRMYELRAEGIKSDKDIADELNNLGYLSRPIYEDYTSSDGFKESRQIGGGLKMTDKKIQAIIKYTKYAGVICEKWTNYKPIRAQYEGLVSIETFNRANRGKVRIVENPNTKELSIFYGSEKEAEKKPEKRPRTIHRPDFVYRKVVYSPYGNMFPRGSLSKGRGGQMYPNYHCVVPFDKARQGIELPAPSESGYSFSCPRDIFEDTIFRFFDAIIPEPPVIDMFIEYVDSIWEKFNEREETDEEQLKRKKDSLEKKLEKLLYDIERLAIKDESPAIKIILDRKNQEYLSTQSELAATSKIKPEIRLTDRDKFKVYARAIIENIGRTVRNLESEEMAKVLFDLVFERIPHYDELLNFSAPIFPVFRLNEDILKSYDRTNRETASAIGKHYSGKPRNGTKSKAVKKGEIGKSRTKIKSGSSLNKAKKEDPPFDESSENLRWQPQ